MLLVKNKNQPQTGNRSHHPVTDDTTACPEVRDFSLVLYKPLLVDTSSDVTWTSSCFNRWSVWTLQTRQMSTRCVWRLTHSSVSPTPHTGVYWVCSREGVDQITKESVKHPRKCTSTTYNTTTSFIRPWKLIIRLEVTNWMNWVTLS